MTVAPDEVSLLVPVKAFDQAKFRLAPHVDPSERQRLARAMATHVVSVAAPLPVAIVCDDDNVAEWCASVGARLIWTPGTGLNGAVQQGVDVLGELGFRRVIVAHSDLPLAANFSELASWSGVTLVPDRHRMGSNVVAVPTDAGFRFSYGTGSYSRHIAEAVRVGRGIRVVHQERLAWDVDFPTDLNFPANLAPRSGSPVAELAGHVVADHSDSQPQGSTDS